MNPYTRLGSSVGTHDAVALSARLAEWHDAMVAHERRLRAAGSSDSCHDECPHAEAVALWAEALDTFGARANELIFLRSRASEGSRVLRLPMPQIEDGDAVTRAAAPVEARAEL